ncbi:MAG: ABC transporter permease [Bdellovibrionaceae bacterium]|nr:ABC transporter permease [Pseudobdellovibrionaceae bacterium]
MPIREILLLAYEALMSNKLRAGLTMLGMIIGVGAVVSLVSIGNGAKNYITSEFEGLGSNLIMIQPGKTDSKGTMGPPMGNSKKKLSLADLEALERQSFNLDAITGLMFGTAAVTRTEATSNVTLLGVNDQFIKIFNIKVGLGQFISRDEDDSARRVAVLGNKTALNLFGDEAPIGQWVKINQSEHRVIGVLAASGQTLGFNMDDMVMIPTRTAMRLLNDDKLFGLRAKAKSKVGIDDAVDEIKAILKKRQNGEENFTVTTQLSMLQSMNTILGMLTFVLGGIAMISMIVGGIGIMNIMLVSVTERTREIGIRRAVGARRVDVLKQFLFEAITLSMIGGTLGLGGSTLLTYAVYWFVPSFDMRAPIWVLAPAFLMSLLTGVIFGVFPARKASQIETIEALRYE